METEVETILSKTRIKRLVMDGFKSFGKYTELNFGEKFNVVLGPNGSGKSNILDALCFVLGKSSSKQLRAEKSANLIYNGGKTKQPAKKAEVSIVFDNTGNVFPLEDKEIKISRIVRGDGASKYQINGQTRTRQEIVELLNSARIDPDGYNVILQGDIIRLVEMSTNERRQIIEEIAGIGLYEEKKQQAMNELTKVEDKLNEADIILKERHGYLRDLKKDRDQALKYKELSDKIKTNKASYLHNQKNRKDEQLQKLTEKKKQHEDKLTKQQEKIKKERDVITQHKQEIQAISNEIEQKGEKDQVELQKHIETVRVNLATNKTRISTCKNDIAKIEQRKTHLEKNSTDITAKITTLKEDKQQLHAQTDALSQTINELQGKIDAFRKKHKLEEEENLDSTIEQNEKETEQKQHELQQLREKQQQLIREKDKTEFQLQAIDEKINKVKALEEQHKEELKTLRKKKEEFKKTTLELNDLLNQDSEDARALAQARGQLQEEREHQHKLELKESSIKEHLGSNIAIKKIKEHKQLGGVYGTISELGSTSSKYATALEVAAASKMNSIVTDDEKTAARAIQYLKKERFGTATFLPLNKIRPATIKQDVQKLSKEKGVQGLAIDLIDFEPQYKNAFSHVFGSTLIVDNLATARKIGIGRARMVTLDGDLCEHSGAMVGGYRHKKAGGFREKELGQKLEKTRERIANLEQHTQTLEQRRATNEEKIGRIREVKAHLEGEIIKQEKSLHLDTSDLDATHTYKQELIKRAETLGKEQRELEQTISKTLKEVTTLKTGKEQLRKKISELRNPRVLAELNAFEEKKRQLEQERIRLEEQEKSLAAQIKDILERDQDSTQKLIKELRKEHDELKQEIQTLEKQGKEQEKTLRDKEKEQETFTAQFKGLFEKRNKLSDEITNRETNILKHEEHARKEELQLNTLSIEEARLSAELASVNAEYEQYEGIEIDTKKSEDDLKKEIQQFERMMTNIGNVNMRALEIYETAEREYEGLMKKKETLLSEKEDVVQLMQEIEHNKTALFSEALSVVNNNFQNIFGQLTTKGQAYLELENKDKPFDGGLRIKVKLTGNKFMDIRSLSGGEKTLTALAFLFAIQEHQPATFYIMDEVDAALDKHNSEKLAKLIRSYCGKAQYIVISHNDAVISEGDHLYGVSMKQDSGLSKIMSLNA